MRSLKHQLPWRRLMAFFAIGVSIYVAQVAKDVAPSLSAVLTALQVILVVVSLLLGITRIRPLQLVRPQRDAIDGEFYECRSIPILGLIVIAPIAVIFGFVALFALNLSNSNEAKGNVVLFSLLLFFILVPAAALFGTRIIFAPAQVCFWNRLFSRDFLTCVPAANLGPWAAKGHLVFPARSRYLPIVWHLVSDPQSLVTASRRALQDAH